MTSDLNKLTTREFSKLFPIILSEYNPEWVNLFLAEKESIERVIGKENIIRIEHIGSTSIPNLKAKPTIDILIEINENKEIKEEIIKKLTGIKYNLIPKPENPPPHMMFVKGYTDEGFKGEAYHIHVRYKGDWDKIYFRDYLKSHSDSAKKYAELKQRLALEYSNDWEAYTEGKTEFIKHIIQLSRNFK